MDMKDWSGRLFGCDDDTQIFVTEQWRGFIREIIAGEREAAKAQPQPVESGAEVPEWFAVYVGGAEWPTAIFASGELAQKWSTSNYVSGPKDTKPVPSPIFMQSDHARRVAEAVEAKDKQIEILTSYKCTVEAACKALGIDADGLFDRVPGEIVAIRQASAAKDKRIAELEERNRDLLESIMSAYTKLGLHEGNVPGNENLSDTLHRHIAALRQQLAASQAEVAEARKGEITNYWFKLANEREAELTKLREENARLSRPVEGVKTHEILVVRRSGMSVERGVAVADFQRERNAREAAESLIGEVIERLNADTHDGTTAGCWQCELVKKLAAFRAEKGKVQQ